MKHDGDGAFPVTNCNSKDTHFGMSLRDYFAGQALIGALSGNAHAINPAVMLTMVSGCYLLADAMLEARKK